MDAILDYLANHYILFIVLTVLMLFALVGYFAKKKSKESQAYKIADNNTKAEEELETLAQTVNKSASIQDFMKQNTTVNNTVVQPQVNTVSSNFDNQNQVNIQNDQLINNTVVTNQNNQQVVQQTGIESLDNNYQDIQI